MFGAVAKKIISELKEECLEQKRKGLQEKKSWRIMRTFRMGVENNLPRELRKREDEQNSRCISGAKQESLFLRVEGSKILASMPTKKLKSIH